MNPVQLLYAKNTISRSRKMPRQHLEFWMLIENIDYTKKVDVLWSGEDGEWHTLPATFHSEADQCFQYWRAEIHFDLSADASLPGNINFAIRYQVLNKDYWDNNNADDYFIAADSGVRVFKDIGVLNIDYCQELQPHHKLYAITAAVHNRLDADSVSVVWSTDNWKTQHETPCVMSRDYWNNESASNARNPNQYGYGIWKCELKIDHVNRIDYAICCKIGEQVVWEPEYGRNYFAKRRDLKVLALNLHCYQEDEQDLKFTRIANAVVDLDIDILCLQEVAEPRNKAKGDHQFNAAKIIRDRLPMQYHLLYDKSHIGFEKYNEGCAILSRYPLSHKASRYVSTSQDIHDIHARKVVMAQVYVPYFGNINIFSAHLSWWDGGFEHQFSELTHWVNDKDSSEVVATLVCGDFNIPVNSQGYALVVNSGEFEDEFLKATQPDKFHTIFVEKAQNWQEVVATDGRIDYIFLKTGGRLQATSSKFIFSDEDYGRVSDHRGCFAQFELKL